MKRVQTMKRIIMLVEVENNEQQQNYYDVLQDMIEDRAICGYFTLVDNGEAVEDLPDYMGYEKNDLIPVIAGWEADFIRLTKRMDNKHGSINDDNL